MGIFRETILYLCAALLTKKKVQSEMFPKKKKNNHPTISSVSADYVKCDLAGDFQKACLKIFILK